MSDLIAPVSNGQVIQQTDETSSSTKKAKGGGNLDKDDFLQLLVAQMKYQDPLEPASNTEYVSQFATFSELEQMQNVSASTDMNRASNLIGQVVTVKSTGATGDVNYITGTVDYVVYQGNKAMLSVNGSLYSIDTLDSVMDPQYYTATQVKDVFEKALHKLPKPEKVSSKDEISSVQSVIDVYDNMSAYEKSVLSAGVSDLIDSYKKRLSELKSSEESADK